MVTNQPTAMILAAGRGTRMGELGEKCPKALLKINGTPLIHYHLEKLRKVGFNRIVINVCHLADQIKQFIADQYRSTAEIVISQEDVPLETAGGIANALKHIRNDIFPVINADIYSELPFHRLNEAISRLNNSPDKSGCLFMVPNPAHHLKGDFCLAETQLKLGGEERLTFSGIGVYRAAMFSGISENTSFALAPILKREINRGQMLGELVSEYWSDVGTPERLEDVNRFVALSGQ
ncbi:MAG: nucleotidyltransferase family protein [Burkholderiales bacterium]|nr:nucleotidyltransferase family protein [Burkholderiales bacterium]